MAKPPEKLLTVEGMRKCYLEADPNWPPQEERWFESLVNACAKERDRHAMHMRNTPKIRVSRRRWQALRQADDVILKEMPPTIEELDITIKELRASLIASAPRGARAPREPEELTAGRRVLLALLDASRAWQQAAKRANPVLERIRDKGGQLSPPLAFARRIARHVLVAWEQQGFTGWSLHADGTFIEFLARIRSEVYGEETDQAALARALRRDKEIKQFASRRDGT